MLQTLDEIERAADMCHAAVAGMKETFLGDSGREIQPLIDRVLGADDPFKELAKLEAPASEAVRAFNHVRERILPRLDALMKSEKDFDVRLKYASVRGHTQDQSMQVKVAVLKAAAEQPGHALNPRMLSVMYRFSDAVYGCMLATITLPDLGDSLAYIALCLKTQLARMPKAEEPAKVGGGGVTQNFHAPVGAVQAGHHNASHVTQSITMSDDTRKQIGVLRRAAEDLAGKSRQETLEYVDAIEEQVLSPSPKKSVIKQCGKGLRTRLKGVDVATIIDQIMNATQPLGK
jgi:hypothetical protein